MREIEIKARVADSDDLISKLEKQGIELGKPLKQHDVVFGQIGVKDGVKGSIWLRIRTENDSKITFNLKKAIAGQLDNIEHETDIEDAEEMRSIIETMGFELYSDLTKIRRKAKHEDLEVCFDEVPGLGKFIEAEKMVDNDANGEEVTNDLWKFFNSLGISKRDEETYGYDVLERRARGLDS